MVDVHDVTKVWGSFVVAKLRNKFCHQIQSEYSVSLRLIGHVNEYPTMHYFGIPGHTQSMIAYKILTECFWKFQ